jgi:RHS repeat-associated protein
LSDEKTHNECRGIGSVNCKSNRRMQRMKSYRAAETGAAGSTFSTATLFRFSAKYTEVESGLLYYGFRWLRDGRWFSRDPIDEYSFIPPLTVKKGNNASVSGNTYGFGQNDDVNHIDNLGLICDICIYRAKKQLVSSPDYPWFEFDVGHEWFEYPGGSMGFWPTGSIWWSLGKIERPNDPHQGDRTGTGWDTNRMTGWYVGNALSAGIGKGKNCSCATCPEILDCMQKIADAWIASGTHYSLPLVNCRSFVEAVSAHCCLVRGKAK